MNNENITVLERQLPVALPDLAKFALIGREKLSAVRAEIRAIQKVGLAKEVLEQKKAEAQEIAELVTLSEVKIGAMMKEIPSSQGKRTDIETSSPVSEEVKSKTKTEVIEELGFNRQQVSQFQQMAEHEDIVLEAIAEAKENDDIISRSAVLKKIEESKKPHVSFNSGNNEWYTPSNIIEAAREAMGSIDVDIASSDIAQKSVKASEYYTIETNGLDKQLHGNLWLNPPYSVDLINQFITKIVNERDDYDQAVVLVNNATETEWFEKLISIASAVCFPKGRIRFCLPDGNPAGTPLQGQAIVYIGSRPKSFENAFADIGWRVMQIALRRQ